MIDRGLQTKEGEAMSGYLESGEKKKDSLMISIRGWIRTLIDYFICAYIVVITAVLPFYSENGYSYIATEKSLFFRRVSIQMGKAVLLLLFIYIVFSGAVYLWSRKHLRELYRCSTNNITETSCRISM